jgi:hypothetical protein
VSSLENTGTDRICKSRFAMVRPEPMLAEQTPSRGSPRYLRKVVNNDLLANRIESFLDELLMEGMILIIVLGLFVLKDDVQSNLVALIDDGPVTSYHLPYMEADDPWDGLKVAFRAGNQFISGLRIGRVGPKDDNMRKHGGMVNAATPSGKAFFRASIFCSKRCVCALFIPIKTVI